MSSVCSLFFTIFLFVSCLGISPAAVDQVMQFMGMHPCERSNKVTEGKSTHVLLLAGMFRNHEKVLVRARLALTDSVTMKIAVRSADEVLRQVVVSAVG